VVAAPLRIALWALPTAALAFAIHAARLAMLDRRLRRTPRSAPAAQDPGR